MSERSIKIKRCDRCKIEAADESLGAFDRWGRIAALQTGTDISIGCGTDGHDDLCPNCFGVVITHYYEGSSPAIVPAALARPTKPVRAVRITIEHKRKAAAAIVASLKEQIQVSLDAVREAPTEILAGSTIDGAYAGIDERANQLVAEVLRQLRLNEARR